QQWYHVDGILFATPLHARRFLFLIAALHWIKILLETRHSLTASIRCSALALTLVLHTNWKLPLNSKVFTTLILLATGRWFLS
ncbi:MAG: hypothetical protein SGILL_006661, partial [Bacillariaceae sp.]